MSTDHPLKQQFHPNLSICLSSLLTSGLQRLPSSVEHHLLLIPINLRSPPGVCSWYRWILRLWDQPPPTGTSTLHRSRWTPFSFPLEFRRLQFLDPLGHYIIKWINEGNSLPVYLAPLRRSIKGIPTNLMVTYLPPKKRTLVNLCRRCRNRHKDSRWFISCKGRQLRGCPPRHRLPLASSLLI